MAEVYLAGKVNSNEGSISGFADELEERGHTITYKWWEAKALKKPYLEHIESSRPAAVRMVEAVRRSDVTILFPEARILGAAIEFGAAIGDIN